MKKEIIINSVSDEIRIAITEEKRLAELYVETPEKERMVGDIYLGKVAKVMPGIRAAFIDLGLQQDAFLHFSDIGSSLHEYSALIGDEDSDVDTDEDSDEDEPTAVQDKSPAGTQPEVTTAPVRTTNQQQSQRPSRNDGRSHYTVPDLKRDQ